ncbi:MAG: 16S rRNA (uracil(1498)-N(3))-methyltransferase [Gammaproteobacteria bacterium]|nr:16S rRNA (uracil(1498)-N(3))-methyltransferase [Gammaproteobacteria bacterium]
MTKRIFIDQDVEEGGSIELPADIAHHLSRVLRLCAGDEVNLFNGQGGEYSARIKKFTRKSATVTVGAHDPAERESALELTLAQGLSRAEHMDYTMQKAVELGVRQIVPLLTERTQGIKRDAIDRRARHWQKIILHACEQCGRNRIPRLQPLMPLQEWLLTDRTACRLLLSPQASGGIHELRFEDKQLTVMVGPEGGFTENEVERCMQAGYICVRLGPRILRTETAAPAILAVCQALWGDLH